MFSIASGLSKKSERVQVATLLHVAGPKALEVYNAFTWDSEGDEHKIGKILEKFETYCKPRKNVTWERHIFNTRNQQMGESIDQYLTDLKTKARSCEFGDLCDSFIRDRIICGITCDKTRGRLLREGDITLQKAVDICRANEAMTLQLKTISNPATANITMETEIHPIGHKLKKETTKPPCNRCGLRHTPYQTCPAQGAECYKCGRKNHFAKQPPSNIHAVQHNSADEPDDLFIGMVQSNTNSKDWKTTLVPNKQKTIFKLDTGAQCNVISKHRYSQVSREPLRTSHARLIAFGGTQLHTCGKTTIICQHKGRSYDIEFEVVDQNVPSILGLKGCIKMNLIQQVDAIQVHAQNIFSKYSDVFDGLGCITDVIYHIEINQNSNPPHEESQ